MAEVIPTNDLQTPITEEFLDSLKSEVKEQFLDCVNNIEFVKRLISPSRKRAKDLPRDEKGRIIVDLVNPHILENMNYFRQSALHFKKYGCYTKLRPNGNPNSEYGRWLRQERDRCWNGMVRPEDGEWIPGLLYWFLNYCPMMVNKEVKGTNFANRVEDFPEFWEGIYWRFHYLHQARYGGLYNDFKGGQHASELSRRGAHPYFQKVITPDGIKTWGEIKVGDKLFGTYGNEVTVMSIPFDGEDEYYKITLRDGREVYATGEHNWEILEGHKKKQILTTEELLERYKKAHKISDRCPKGIVFDCFIPANKGVDFPYKETKVNPYTFGLMLGDGCFRHDSAYFTQLPEDFEEEQEYIPYVITKWSGKYSYRIGIPNWKNIIKEYGLYKAKSEDKFIPDEYKFNSRQVRLDVLKGLCDTDGTSSRKNITFTTVSEKLRDDVMWISRSLGYNCNYTKSVGKYKKDGELKICNTVYTINIYGGPECFNLFRKAKGVKYTSSNQLSRKVKTCIVNIEKIGSTQCKCVDVDSWDSEYLIGDFVNTHNCSKSYSLAAIMSHNLILGESQISHKRFMTILTAYKKEYLSDKDGTLTKFTPILDHCATYTQFPRLKIVDSPNRMLWQMGFRNTQTNAVRGSRNAVAGVSCKDDSEKLRGKRGYILFEEFGSFKNLTNTYNTVRDSVEEGNTTFSLLYLVGTSGDKDSDFEGAKELVYNPKGYNIYALPNVFDKPNQGRPTFSFFFPAYINRKGCYNKDGVSDVVKALVQILETRYVIKHNTQDPNSILKKIAEMPITPAEAIIKVRRNTFPTVELNEQIIKLDANPNEYSDVYVGKLFQDVDGKVAFKPTADEPIRTFPLGDNKSHGAVEIYKMPEKDKSGNVYRNRYIIGNDPVDQDQSDTLSLSSSLVLDLWTDRIVAEYTGRQEFADENYEILRLLCLFYNAECLYENNIKGTYSYFKKMNCTYLLSDTPEYLKDKDMIRGTKYGNTAKGVPSLTNIIGHAEMLIRDWLCKPVNTINDEGDEVTVSNLHFIRNRALLQELASYNPEINTDRVRALGVLMILREQELVFYNGNVKEEKSQAEDPNYMGNCDFFKRNYQVRSTIKLD